MSLLVFKQTSPGIYSAFSMDGVYTNPITTVHHGRNGDTFEQQLYIGREIGNASSFTNVRIKPISSINTAVYVGSENSPGTSGWGVKIMVDPGHEPTESEWDMTNYGSTIDLANISTDTKLPFWFRIESPRGIAIQNKKDIALLLMFTETP